PARHYETIRAMIDGWEVDPRIRQRAQKILEALAHAEAKVHGTPLEKVHFHEVGAVDSIIDICGAAWGFHHLDLKKVVCSPINVGSGTVETEHGTLPVPAPATLELLRGIPSYSSGPPVELTTPTGAAIAKTQMDEFGPFPTMTPKVIGLGAGTRELSHPNVVRIVVGKFESDAKSLWERDDVEVLETHLDDVTAEVLGFVTDRLMEKGALDVAHGPVTMKKNRPGIRLTVIAPLGLGERLAEIVVRETGALGLRVRREPRLKVPRSVTTVKTRYGDVRVKVARFGDETLNVTPEYDDCAKAAQTHGVPLRTVYDAALKAPRS
ncbi:MAG: nickel pincer cofactor biosynthesis protein LarC, partial [Myxococcota bacterium]